MTNKLERDKEIDQLSSEHHTHTFESDGVHLFAYFDKSFGHWIIQNRNQSTINFEGPLDPPLHMRNLNDIRENIALQERVVELEGKLSNFALQVCDANECEQNSEKQGEILESLLHDALDILGRTDS